jgi:hypothetical protein
MIPVTMTANGSQECVLPGRQSGLTEDAASAAERALILYDGSRTSFQLRRPAPSCGCYDSD